MSAAVGQLELTRHDSSPRPDCPALTALGLPCDGSLAWRADGTLTDVCFSHLSRPDQVAFRAAWGRPSSGGSVRRPCAARLDRHAAALATAAAAAMSTRVPGWLAAVRDAAVRSGMRADGVLTLLRVLAVTAALSDHATGANAAPGRDVVAHVLGINPRAVTRAWAVARRLGVMVRSATGKNLTAAEREQLTAEHRAELAERNARRAALGQAPQRDRGPRWARRAAAELVWPADIGERTEADIEPHMIEALAVLSALARPVGSAVTVTPPTSLVFLLLFVPVRRTHSTSRKGTKDAASRRAPRRRDRRCVRSGVSPEALALARELARGPLSQLSRVPLDQIGRELDRLGLSGYTAADVIAAIEARLRATGKSVPAVLTAPIGWLRWALADADPSNPPTQTDRERQRAEQLATRERADQRRAADAEQAARAATPTGRDAGVAACRAATRPSGPDAARRRARAERPSPSLAAALAIREQRTPDTCAAGHPLGPPPGPSGRRECTTCAAWVAGADPPPPVPVDDQAAPPSPRSLHAAALAELVARAPHTCATCRRPGAADVRLYPTAAGPMPCCADCAAWLDGPSHGSRHPDPGHNPSDERNRST